MHDIWQMVCGQEDRNPDRLSSWPCKTYVELVKINIDSKTKSTHMNFLKKDLRNYLKHRESKAAKKPRL